MEVTVKTLDSQTKSFQVSTEATVKDFKAKIADEMKIPVEKQRLIFQGKVLQDDKLLQEYKVDGCVVHLVERQPPRTTRSNGQSTETTTGSTATTSSPGNMLMGAFTMPVDVMGVTQQIVQGIIQQIGAESAQANISTSSSDDGSSVNVHINLSTVMARNDARSRIAPARVHLNNVSRIIQRLQNDGMPSSRDLNEENSSSERRTSNGTAGNNNNETSLGDLADVLQQVVRLSDEFRPHLERYQELLRSGRERELRPSDDLLPDLAAEALHSLSHAYHALSDVTTNFRVTEPRLNVLPSMSPIPVSVAHMRNVSSSNSQSQASTSSSGATTIPSTGIPSGIPIGIGLRPGGGLGSGFGLRTGRGLGPSFFRPGFSLSPGNGMGATFGSRDGPPPLVPSGVGRPPPLVRAPVVPADRAVSASSNGNGASSTPNAIPTANGSVPVPQNQPPNPFANLPINLRNLPNFALQFNPASGNITIAHIVTTVVEEPSLRTTTTTTNSTPSPRTSSRGSNSVPDTDANPTPQGVAPMVQDETPLLQDSDRTPQSDSPTPQIANPTSGIDSPISQNGNPTREGDSSGPLNNSNQPDSNMDSSQPPSSTPATSTSPSRAHGNSQTGDNPRETNAVVNFMPQNPAHRDPLLPCQSFHFASLMPRSRSRSAGSQSSAGGLSTSAEPQRLTPVGDAQPGDRPSSNDITAHLLNISQHAAAAAASSGNTNGIERNPFLHLFTPQSQAAMGSSDPTGELMLHMATTVEENRRSMTTEELAEERASVERQGTLSRYLHRLLETIPLTELLMTAFAGTSDPYILTRSMTREFLRNDILRGEEPTPQNLQRATERILEELKASFETSFALCNVKENIDGPATLLTYLRPKIRRLLEIINSSEPDSVYLTEVSALLSRTSVELVVLTEYCLQDGRSGMENALRRSLGTSDAIASLEPGVRNMAVNTLWACIEDLRSQVTVRESSLMPFVVRKEKRKTSAKKTESGSPKLERKEEKKEKSSNARSSVTPRAASSNTPSSSSRRTRTRSSSQTGDDPMETDENWKKVIPAEWVPVISQDIIRQQRMARQAPFSDAYRNGMPPKRRKIQQNEPAPYNQCVSATLKRSITKAGVTPKTDVEKLSEEANSSHTLERVFEDEVKSEVRKRLATDTDYNSEKFPSIHKYFESDEKR